jgi:hypothetical protein
MGHFAFFDCYLKRCRIRRMQSNGPIEADKLDARIARAR